MNLLATLSKIFSAARELGPGQLALYARYRWGLLSGRYARRAARRRSLNHPVEAIHPVWKLPDRRRLESILGETGKQRVLEECALIEAGKFRLFGGPAAALYLGQAGPKALWTDYALDRTRASLPGSGTVVDPKDIWEPGRFGWVYPLGRAFVLTGDERWAQVFWNHWEIFQEAHPAETGPQWLSAQEVALRLLALTFGGQVFGPAAASTPARLSGLAQAVAAHAARIPDTLVYARAQANNHLLSEAAGLYTAAAALPDHPEATEWRRLGRYWFQQGLLEQITAEGVYSQHSCNYTRLVLKLALWMDCLFARQADGWDPEVQEKLAAATRWLLAHSDPASGQAPNLGPNDGANILPLAEAEFWDYRPVLQASGKAFMGVAPFPPGPWDELGLWLVPEEKSSAPTLEVLPGSADVIRRRDSWAYLRAAQFTGRPGHADQLHVDLWWRGYNLARDPGTYRYTSPPPWDNALAGTGVHNTVVLNGQDQMQRSGRFLWLGRAQAYLETGPDSLQAWHTGYRRLAVRHQRALSASPGGGWRVLDRLEQWGRNVEGEYSARLHWLLPDWPWKAEEIPAGMLIQLAAPDGGNVQLRMAAEGGPITRQVVRAGVSVFGKAETEPVLGWYSPAYRLKEPALAVILTVSGNLPLKFVSEWVTG